MNNHKSNHLYYESSYVNLYIHNNITNGMIKIYSFLFFATLIVIGFSCSSKKEVQNDLPLDTIQFELKKGACFGRCPRYTLSIFPDGKSLFKGVAYSSKIGTFKKQLSSNEIESLTDLFKESNFQSYPDTFPSMIPDLPGIWISYHDGVTSKTVYGKEGRPEQLLKIQAKLEEIANSDNWNQIIEEDKRTKERNSATMKDRIIIQPEPGKLTNAWLNSYQKFGLAMIKKLSNDLNYYLLTYDVTKISPEEMIARLKKDPIVKLVEFDKVTSIRKYDRSR